jgi:hypothetical protein
MCPTRGNRALIAGIGIGVGIDDRLRTYPDAEARRPVTSGADIDCDTDPNPDTWNSG